MPPRSAAMLAAGSEGCRFACATGSFCDQDTGTCVSASEERTSAEGASAGADTSDAPSHSDRSLPFLCATADGTDDDVVAVDVESAERACAALSGEPCTCRPPE